MNVCSSLANLSFVTGASAVDLAMQEENEFSLPRACYSLLRGATKHKARRQRGESEKTSFARVTGDGFSPAGTVVTAILKAT